MARYREIFFVVLNLAFSMILYGALVRSITLGSTDGFGVPRPTYLGIQPTSQGSGIAMFLLTATVALAAGYAIHRYLKSPMGFAYSPDTWQLVLSTTLLLVIVFMPGGLWSLFAALRRKGARS